MLRSLSYANVMSTLAVFVALGGSAYAASQLPSDSVGSRQIKDGSVAPRDLSRSARRALRGRAGPRGRTGAQGPTGTQGVAGAPGLQGEAGSARAYAWIDDDKTIVQGVAKNVSSVVVDPGDPTVTCVQLAPPVDVTKVQPVVTPDFDLSPDSALFAFVQGDLRNPPRVGAATPQTCPLPNSFAIYTGDFEYLENGIDARRAALPVGKPEAFTILVP